MAAKHPKIRVIVVFTLDILLLGLLQTTLLSRLDILGSSPDLLLVFSILAGYMFGVRDGLIVGLSAGFMRDMLAGRAIGLGMLLLMYAAILAAILFKHWFRRNILLGLIQVILLTVLYEASVMMLSFILPMLPDVALSLRGLFVQRLAALPGHILANVACGIPLIFLLYFLGPYKRGTPKDGTEEAIVGDSVWRVS
jgi:rod shape-determining protein MreD